MITNVKTSQFYKNKNLLHFKEVFSLSVASPASCDNKLYILMYLNSYTNRLAKQLELYRLGVVSLWTDYIQHLNMDNSLSNKILLFLNNKKQLGTQSIQ